MKDLIDAIERALKFKGHSPERRIMEALGHIQRSKDTNVGYTGVYRSRSDGDYDLVAIIDHHDAQGPGFVSTLKSKIEASGDDCLLISDLQRDFPDVYTGTNEDALKRNLDNCIEDEFTRNDIQSRIYRGELEVTDGESVQSMKDLQ